MTDEGDTIQIPFSWVGVEELPVHAANHFLVQADGDMHYLTIGHATPPVLLGSPEDLKRQLTQLGLVPVKPLGRFALSRSKAQELVGVLTSVLEKTASEPGSRIP